MAAVAVVLMCIGTIIPVATYVVPVLCILICQMVCRICGKRIAWAWYGAVSILGLLMAPDKEAASVFLALGYYPIVKPKLDAMKCRWLWKTLLFNGSVLVLYWFLLKLIGIDQLVSEFDGMGFGMYAVLLILGNVTFIALDKLLDKKLKFMK